MKKHCIRILSAFFGLAALALTAKAQAVDQLVVNIPYEFVAAGKTLPAGTYRINRVGEQNVRELSITGIENRSAVFVLSSEAVYNASAKQPGLTFQKVGDQHLLSKIETAEHVFTIPVFSPVVRESAMKPNSGPARSGSSGSN